MVSHLVMKMRILPSVHPIFCGNSCIIIIIIISDFDHYITRKLLEFVFNILHYSYAVGEIKHAYKVLFHGVGSQVMMYPVLYSI